MRLPSVPCGVLREQARDGLWCGARGEPVHQGCGSLCLACRHGRQQAAGLFFFTLCVAQVAIGLVQVQERGHEQGARLFTTQCFVHPAHMLNQLMKVQGGGLCQVAQAAGQLCGGVLGLVQVSVVGAILNSDVNRFAP